MTQDGGPPRPRGSPSSATPQLVLLLHPWVVAVWVREVRIIRNGCTLERAWRSGRARGPQSDRVSQATRMIAVQAGCSLPEAFDLLRERAFAIRQQLELTALDVLDGLIRFDD